MPQLSESRRDFLKKSSLIGTGLLASIGSDTDRDFQFELEKSIQPHESEALDFSPAKWIWYPSERCLPNTMILFQKVVELTEGIRSAKGWILGESRYLLFANRERIQFGPAPNDPRFSEADPVDLTHILSKGRNIIGIQVLFYGHGDGTWPAGKPGLIFKLEIETNSGKQLIISTDKSWKSFLTRSWKPGMYKRWYLRSFQEAFDLRIFPHKWTTDPMTKHEDWLTCMEIGGKSNKPAINSSFRDHLGNIQTSTERTRLLKRQIPMLDEAIISAKACVETHRVIWNRPPLEYFELLSPNAYAIDESPIFSPQAEGPWEFSLHPEKGSVLTFEFEEQLVGWPIIELEVSDDATFELMVQEAHETDNLELMNNHFHAWSRCTCNKGENRFECFDFESLRWIQLHFHPGKGKVRIKQLSVRRRSYPFAQNIQFATDDNLLQKLVDASINTLRNCAQETLVDGMGRERQQYSGDVGHQIHVLYAAFGEYRLPERYIRTFSYGMTKDGYFLDTWPAYDRLARIAQRQLDFTPWGPILDHGVGFVFDTFTHFQYTGDLGLVREVFPSFVRFITYLQSIRGKDKLLPVEDIGIPIVWIDNHFKEQKHKKCAFNLYVAAMCIQAFYPLCKELGENKLGNEVLLFGYDVLAYTLGAFWDEEKEIFVCNKPWLAEEGKRRYDYRSLSLGVLYDLCPNGNTHQSIQMLKEAPSEMAHAFPANGGWKLWALAKAGEGGKILDILRNQWAKMPSVSLNNTLQEGWTSKADSNAQWSHAGVVPLYQLYMSIAGITPLKAGGKRIQIYPQPHDLQKLQLSYYTPLGKVEIDIAGKKGNRSVRILLPAGCTAEFILHKDEKPGLTSIGMGPNTQTLRYEINQKWEGKLTLT